MKIWHSRTTPRLTLAREWAWGLVGLGVVLMAMPVFSADQLIVESFDALALGPLEQTNGWVTAPSTSVVVQGYTMWQGGQALSVVDADITVSFTNSTATNVWLDFYAMPEFGTHRASPTDMAGELYVNTNGYFVVSSNATWVTMDHISPLSTGRWYRISINVNCDSRRWELYVADDTTNKLSTAVATNLVFHPASTNASLRRFRAEGRQLD
jgi:hypothetical protein